LTLVPPCNQRRTQEMGRPDVVMNEIMGHLVCSSVFFAAGLRVSCFWQPMSISRA
jgi:hypothetical protein